MDLAVFFEIDSNRWCTTTKESEAKKMDELKLLGKRCRDYVTGFEGICVGLTEWMYGCSQYILQPKAQSDSKKNSACFFYEKQLSVVDDGITEKVEIPPYDEPVLFGKECEDKVTGVKGICVGRTIYLFTCTQYFLEIIQEDQTKENRMVVLDEGRIKLAEKPKREIKTEDVQGTRAGGLLDKDMYPPKVSVPTPGLCVF